MPRILIIDDEKAVADTCALVLSGAGHTVAIAPDGLAGLHVLRTEPADLILTDLQMPYGGLPAIQQLRRLYPKVPIIVMSGAGKTQLDGADTIGAHYTLSKPFTTDELNAAVAQMLQGQPKSPPSA